MMVMTMMTMIMISQNSGLMVMKAMMMMAVMMIVRNKCTCHGGETNDSDGDGGSNRYFSL